MPCPKKSKVLIRYWNGATRSYNIRSYTKTKSTNPNKKWTNTAVPIFFTSHSSGQARPTFRRCRYSSRLASSLGSIVGMFELQQTKNQKQRSSGGLRPGSFSSVPAPPVRRSHFKAVPAGESESFQAACASTARVPGRLASCRSSSKRPESDSNTFIRTT